MNQQTYRIIFNQARGCLMAVAETATARGKGASGERTGTGKRRCKPLRTGRNLLAALALLGGLYMSPLVLAQTVATRIVADPNAPRTQQATVLTTSNGVVQVNIQTPSSAGVSRNTFNQFDVGNTGAILNNSRANAQTQQGGWVQGNPWLATGSARVILNEVNSANPSQLQGYVEVAGQRAEVVIANPAGINVNGAGFINASGVTLTTGTPVVNNGNLDSYRVQGGSIRVDGVGLDTRSADYTAVLARAVQANAGIWANRLQVVTGANQIEAASLGSDGTIQATALAGAGAAPAYAVDVSQLGGMYAGKITLVGTEAGLGVRNAGLVQAASGPLTLSSEGWLQNSGTLQASGGELKVQTGGSIEQSGTVYSDRSVQLTSQASQTHSGTTAALGNVSIQATGTNADGTAAHIQANTRALWAAGLQADGTLTGHQNLTVQATGQVQTAGQALATGQLQLTTPQALVTDGARIQGGSLGISANSLSNVAGQIAQTGSADQSLVLQGNLNNTAGIIQSNASHLNISAQNIDNTAGQLLHAGAGSLSLSSQGQLLNHTQNASQTPVSDGGRIVSAGALSMASANLSNSGSVFTAQSLDTRTATLNNSGTLYAAGQQTLTASAAVVSSGTIAAAKDLTIQANRFSGTSTNVLAAGMAQDGKLTGTGALSASTTGTLQSAGQALATGQVSLAGASQDLSNSVVGSTAGDVSLSASSGNILTRNAQISSPGLLSITANAAATQTLDNTAGQLSAKQLQINVGQLDNSQGTLLQTGAGAQAASIRSAGALTNTGGTMVANAQDLTLSAGGQLDNTGGQIGHAGSGTFTLSSAGTDNTHGKILGNAVLTFTATGDVNNNSGLVAAQSLSASTTGWNNSQGKLVTTQGDLSLRTARSAITNSAGLIQSAQDLRLTQEGTATQLQNNQGKIVAARDAALSAGPLTNQAGLIAAGRQLGISSSGALNNAAFNNTAANNQAGLIYSGADLTLQATSVDNSASQILAVGNATVAAGSGSLTNTAGLVRVGQTLAVQAASVDNTGTRAFNSDGSPKATGLEGNSIAITTGQLNNNQGAVRAAQDLSVRSDGQINNQQGELSAGRNLQIDTWQASTPRLSISNQSGQIVADRSVNVRTGSLSGAGTIASRGDVTLSLQGDHTLAGTLQAAGDLSLSATGQITNPISVQAGQNLSVSANMLGNQATGELLSGRTTRLNVADTLTNRGLIDGADTRIQAGNVNNLGTGRIYGDRVAIAATTLSNQEESTAGATIAATIAGRQQVQLGVQTLTNQENALLYSGGDMGLGGALNANGQATGTAQSVNNHSATIEAAQNLSIQAASIRNTNEHFVSQVQQTSQTQKTEYQHQTGDVYRVNDISTRFAASEVSVTPCEVTCLESSAGKSDAFIKYDYTRTINEDVVTQSAPGKILAGGGITLTATNVLNDKSQIVAGGTLNVQAASLSNVQGAGTQTTTDVGTATSYWRIRRKGTDGTGTSTTAYTPAAVEQTITLGANRFEQGTANASTNTAPTASTLSTVQAQASSTGALAAGPGLSTVAGTRANTAAGTTTPGNTAGQSGSAQTQVKTLQPGSQIPNTSLYKTHPESGAHYLVETDPRFANYKTWLGSDYMLSALQIDPATAQKRLGDGFYEQKLIRDQVLALTGNRYLGDYRDDEAQYMALMNSGLTYAKQFDLRPGIALTPDQVAQLTSDMVWLVTQEVTLADGTKQSVLVPQVYVRVRPGDLDGSGALLAGADVNLNLSGDLNNSGTIAGRNALKVSADNIRNLAGTIGGDSVSLNAKQDIDNIGGLIEGASAAVATAGRDLNLRTTTQSSTNAAGTNSFAQTGIDRVAGLYVKGSTGTLVASAGRDLNLTAATVKNAGTGPTLLTAGNNLNLGTVNTGSSQNIVWDANNRLSQSNSQDLGSQINAAGNLTLSAGNDLNAKAAAVNAGQTLSVNAGHNVSISAGQSTQSLDEAHQHTSSGFLSSSTTTTRNQQQSTSAVASNFEGNSVAISAGQDLSVKGSNVLADQNVQLNAGGNVNIEAAQNTSTSSSYRQETKSGLMSGGGIGFTVGSRMQSVDGQGTSTSAAGSTVGSTGGNVTINAGGAYTQTGSDVLTPNGNIDISAKAVTITEARETGSQSTEQKFKQSGLTVAVTSPVISALQMADSQINAAGNTGSSRMQALAAANAAINLKQGAGQVQDALGKGDATGGAGISVSVGSSSSQSSSQSSADNAKGSNLSAGGNIRIAAVGDGTNSNLTVQGSDIKAAGTTTLKADNQVNLLAAQNTTQESSSNQSKSGSIGLAISTQGVGVTASASKATGQGAGNGSTFTNSHIEGGQQVVIDSGGDTTLKGATVTGNQVTANVAGNLNIESLQDQNQYKESSKSAGGSVMVGITSTGPASGNLNLGKTSINSTYTSVNEQSAIRAGDGGFNVSVNGKTTLTGGQITSTQATIDNGKNSYQAKEGTTTTDLNNSASYSANSLSVGLGAGALPGQSLSAGMSGVGFGSDSGSASSVTTAGISGVAGNTSARTGDQSTSIKPIFDADKVMKEIEAQVTITQEFNKQAGKAITDYTNGQRKALQEQVKNASTPEEKAQAEQAIKDVNMQERALNILVSGLTGMAGATVTKEALSTAAEKMRDLMIEDSKTFKGVVDKDGNALFSNQSGGSAGVNGDGFKLAGTRADLDALCGSDGNRCSFEKNPDGSIDKSKPVTFLGQENADKSRQSYEDFLKTPDGQKMLSAPFGGLQGGDRTWLFGMPYEKGSWVDKLLESFAGPHDLIGGKASGLYDLQGNAKQGMSSAEIKAYDAWSAVALLPAAPFAASQFFSPEVWKAIGILLKAGQ